MALVGVGFFGACEPEGGTKPSPAVTTSSPPVAPTPAATPSPTSVPGPAPSPIGPGGPACSLPPSSASQCRSETPVFRSQLELAQSEVRRTRPDLFDGSVVRDQDAYAQAVALRLQAFGFCAQAGQGDRIGLKSSNVGSERYDIVLSSGEPWTGYMETCRPAHF